MPPALNLEGHVFERLTCVRRVNNSKHGKSQWLCKCSCGKEKIIITSSLLKGVSKSCGCLRRELAKKNNITHGKSYKNYYIYEVWRRIKTRCTNPNSGNWRNYGGRGITFHPEWSNNFESFHTYIINTIGDRPSEKFTLDRTNNDQGYLPENLRWATRSTQCFNQRHPKKSKLPQGVRTPNYKKYIAQISINNKRVYLGSFSTEKEASDAYTQACVKLRNQND